MKIKLNSNSEIARKIAMCFVGNLINSPIKTKLQGVSDHQFIIETWAVDYCYGIVIDLSTAKFDPFAAMRESVSVQTKEIGMCKFSGMINSYERGMFFVGNSCNGCNHDQINLDLDWALAQEGVEEV